MPLWCTMQNMEIKNESKRNFKFSWKCHLSLKGILIDGKKRQQKPFTPKEDPLRGSQALENNFIGTTDSPPPITLPGSKTTVMVESAVKSQTADGSPLEVWRQETFRDNSHCLAQCSSPGFLDDLPPKCQPGSSRLSLQDLVRVCQLELSRLGREHLTSKILLVWEGVLAPGKWTALVNLGTWAPGSIDLQDPEGAGMSGCHQSPNRADTRSTTNNHALCFSILPAQVPGQPPQLSIG